MSTFEEVRKVTGLVRPPGNHGCKLVEVVPGLFTAHFHDIQDAGAFTRLGLTPPVGFVVNAAIAYKQCDTGPGYYGPGVEVLPLDVLDDPKPDEPHTEPSDAKQYFPLVNAKIKETIASGKSAIIHCMASISRSAVFIIAYLVEEHHMSVTEATALLKSKFDATWPNDAFVHQLIAFEAEVAARK